METGFKKIICWLLLFFSFSACEKFEMRGFILSYETANQRFEQSMDWNYEHPFKEITIPVEDYTIYAMSDCHAGGTKNLDFFLNEAKRMNAVAAVMAGDLTRGHAKDYYTFQQHLPSQDSLISFQMVGNHDLFFDGWKQFYSLFGSTSYIFTVKTPQASDLYICLDTGGGTLGSNQLDWLKDILETDRPNYRHCILFTHNNLFRIRHTDSANPFVEELQVLIELCIKHQIDMVVAGHDHLKNVVKLGNTTHITLDALEDDFKQAGYLILSVKQGKIEYEFINL
jgi:predicted phosphodiesterase